MNDIYDREKDRKANKQRPIALGDLPLRVAYISAITFVTVSLGLVTCLFGFAAALWIGTIAVALLAYSPVARRWPLVKGLYTAGLAISPFLFAHTAFGFVLPATILGLLLAYVVFRETVLDALDMKSDAAYGTKTVAFFIGANNALAIGWVGMFVVLLLSIVAMELYLGKIAIVAGLAFQMLSGVLFLARVPHSLGLTRFTLASGAVAVGFTG